MVCLRSVCLRRLAQGRRDGIVGFSRFLANPRVTLDGLLEGWGAEASQSCAGRHVLAIQDTSDIAIRTNAEHRRDLGKTGKGSGHGLLLHAMVGVDAASGALLGLVGGKIWTRAGLQTVDRHRRPLSQKETERWVSTGETAKQVLSAAAMVTQIGDRESDFYALWARLPGESFHVLTRARDDRTIPAEEGGRLSAARLEDAGDETVELPAKPGRSARKAKLAARFGTVTLTHPTNTVEEGLPPSLRVNLVEVQEIDPPPGEEPVLWRLLTTHPIEDAQKAWTLVAWYRQRWIIEQLFRTLKQQGLRIEDSQVESAERLIKLTALATQAACSILQLVQARDGRSHQPASLTFTPAQIHTLKVLIPTLEGDTPLQKNHHPPGSLAWAAWAIAKLGGWDGYPKSRPPGPITFANGLSRFKDIAQGRTLRDV